VENKKLAYQTGIIKCQEFLQAPLADLTWYHNQALKEKHDIEP
jgi:hypothetical protein